MTRGTQVHVDLDVRFADGTDTEACRLPAEIEVALYRLIQEALTNTLKHAGATHADVVVRLGNEAVEATIADNGNGFDPGDQFTGFGLLGMRERVALAQGTLIIESQPREGTAVSIVLPVRRGISTRQASATGA